MIESFRQQAESLRDKLTHPAYRAGIGSIVVSPLFVLASCSEQSSGIYPTPEPSQTPQGVEVCVIKDPHATAENDDTGKVIIISLSEAAHNRANYASPDSLACAKKVRVCKVDGPDKGKIFEVPVDDVPGNKHYSTNLNDCPTPSGPSELPQTGR